MKIPASVTAAAALGFAVMLAACTPEEEESVEERFRRTEALIENTAKSIEEKTENAVRGMEAELENEAAVFTNRSEAANSAEDGETETNQAR